MTADGKRELVSSFAISGSGAHLLRGAIREQTCRFEPTASLAATVAQITAAYRAASHDLNVSGFFSLAVLATDAITDYSQRCEEVWRSATSK